MLGTIDQKIHGASCALAKPATKCDHQKVCPTKVRMTWGRCLVGFAADAKKPKWRKWTRLRLSPTIAAAHILKLVVGNRKANAAWPLSILRT
jgi:hypothetical protein